jgi:hypothetical protein
LAPRGGCADRLLAAAANWGQSFAEPGSEGADFGDYDFEEESEGGEEAGEVGCHGFGNRAEATRCGTVGAEKEEEDVECLGD